MKTIEQVATEYKSNAIDGRDVGRLSRFLTEQQLSAMGVELKDEYKGKHQPEAFTREAVLGQLKNDLDFAFEKALDCRGISASCMFAVVCMWNWVLEEGLEDFEAYENYGLPTLKATAVKYCFANPIGDDVGNESKYNGE